MKNESTLTDSTNASQLGKPQSHHAASIEQGIGLCALYPGGGNERLLPIECQIFYAVSRSWDQHVRILPRNTSGVVLLDLFKRTSSSELKTRLLGDIYYRWVDDAEPIISALLKDDQENSQCRIAAGRVLLRHGLENYHEQILNFAKTSDHLFIRERWWDLLVDMRHRSKSGVDARVVEMGFELILEAKRQHPDYAHAGSFIACGLGRYVGENFQPDQTKRYRSKHGLKDEFFADTVKNALHWCNVTLQPRAMDQAGSGGSLPVDR